MKKIIVVGDTLSTCVVAAELASKLQGVASVIVVETTSENVSRFSSPCETLSPTFHDFHRRLRISESDVLSNALGTFNLATRFLNLDSKGHDFLLGFSATGVDFNHVQFQHYFVKHGLDQKQKYDEFSLAAQMALQNKFVHPVNDAKSVLSTLSYGLNVDSHLYGELLKQQACALGVQWLNEPNPDVTSDGQFINQIVASQQRLDADLYIDCTHTGMLMNKLKRTKWQDWSQSIPFNQSLEFTTPRFPQLSTLNSVQANAIGVLKSRDLQNRTEHTLWFDNNLLDGNDVDDVAKSMLELEELHDKQVTKLQFGALSEPWLDNCVAIGPAAVNATPLYLGEAHLAHSGVMRLIDLLPNTKNMDYCSQEFNRLSSQEWHSIQDFHQLYFANTQVQQSAFWHHKNQQTLSLSNQHRQSLFMQSAKVSKRDLDAFDISIWSAWLLGLGLSPKGYEPTLEVVGDPDAPVKMQRMQQIFAQTVQQLPTHDTYLQHYLNRNKAKTPTNDKDSRVYL